MQSHTQGQEAGHPLPGAGSTARARGGEPRGVFWVTGVLCAWILTVVTQVGAWQNSLNFAPETMRLVQVTGSSVGLICSGAHFCWDGFAFSPAPHSLPPPPPIPPEPRAPGFSLNLLARRQHTL